MKIEIGTKLRWTQVSDKPVTEVESVFWETNPITGDGEAMIEFTYNDKLVTMKLADLADKLKRGGVEVVA